MPARASPAAPASWRTCETDGIRWVPLPSAGGRESASRAGVRVSAKPWKRSGIPAVFRLFGGLLDERLSLMSARVSPSPAGCFMDEERSVRITHGRIRSSLGRSHFPGLKRMTTTPAIASSRNANKRLRHARRHARGPAPCGEANEAGGKRCERDQDRQWKGRIQAMVGRGWRRWMRLSSSRSRVRRERARARAARRARGRRGGRGNRRWWLVSRRWALRQAGGGRIPSPGN